MKSAWLIALSFLFPMTSCVEAPEVMIPDGVYSNTNGAETITIAEEQIHFQILITGHAEVFDHPYDFKLQEDGRIQPRILISTHALYLREFQWYWDGTTILQRESETNKLIQEFKRTLCLSGGEIDVTQR